MLWDIEFGAGALSAYESHSASGKKDWKEFVFVTAALLYV